MSKFFDVIQLCFVMAKLIQMMVSPFVLTVSNLCYGTSNQLLDIIEFHSLWGPCPINEFISIENGNLSRAQ